MSDGQAVSVQTQQDAPTDPLSIRDGDAFEPGTAGGVTERERIGGEGTGAIDTGDEPDETDS